MRRLIQITLATMVVTAGITSPAAAQSYVSPDARDSGRHVVGTAPTSIMNGRDLVSPDARDAARHSTPVTDLRSPDTQKPSPVTDLQSPDARDAGKNPVATYEPGHAPTVQPQQPVLQVPATGFNWGDAGIGAAGMLALIALVSGTLMIASHRRRGPLATS
jgi:hypothetical protein